MDHRPLHLASAASVEHMAGLTRRAIGAWQARWGLDSFAPTVEASVWEGTSRPAVDCAGTWSDAVGPATLFWSSGIEASVRGALYPHGADEPSPRGDSLAHRSARHIVDELRRLLCGAWMGQPMDFTEPAAQWEITRWCAPIRVDVALNDASIIIAIFPAPQDSRRPAVERPRLQPLPALDQRGFHSLCASAEMIVGHSEITLLDAASLQAGDVIVLDSLVKDPLRVRLVGTDESIYAHLGQLRGRRGMQVVPSPKH